MSNKPKGDLSSVVVRDLILCRWIDEITKLSELMQVLERSVSYSIEVTTNSGEKRRCVGDDVLARHIRDGLDNLFVEIEEVKDRLSE